jgi:hypothetical protein
MGRKHREERRERREDFVTKRSQQKRKNTLLAVGILGLIGLIVGYASFEFVTMGTDTPGAPPGAGKLGDEHEHASVLVRIFSDKFDFAATTYQIKSSWIHFEESDGNTVHRHSSGVTLGYLFDTLGIGIDQDCYIFADGRQFCTNEDYSLKYFINGDSVNSIYDYVVQDDDRILISYGGETEAQINQQLDELNAQIIRD